MSIDGSRSYCLFDDAMISMRYAWNFSHGLGLVWNTGEYVQGYTNLLMTLIMSVATLVFSKSIAVLSIQILGVVFMLLVAFLTMQIADHVLQEVDERLRIFVRILAFISGVAYYPLVYWSLMGMETGLLTVLLLSGLLLAFRYAKSGNYNTLIASAFLFGLTFLTRNESAIFFVLAWVYLALEIKESNGRIKLGWLFSSAGLFLLIVAGELLFQYLYYGETLPNTYVLKLTGMPLAFRIQNGIGFVLPFVKETAFILVLALVSVIIRYKRKKLVLLFVIVLAIIYQIYVGGDAWNYWRILAPAIPLAMILAIDALIVAMSITINTLVSINRTFHTPTYLRESFVVLFVTLFMYTGVVSANYRFFGEIDLHVKPYHTPGNKTDVDTSVALNDLLRKDATIGVIWAGAIPYYTNYKAVDFLGKSDRYIAHLPPDMSGSVSWGGMSSVPGHNKYDLYYSIIALKPTYVQSLHWGNQNITEWAKTRYVTIEYKGLTLYFLKNSPDVLWSKLGIP
jgi:arabinofuranosyltransferase